jgi:hypothetical protein
MYPSFWNIHCPIFVMLMIITSSLIIFANIAYAEEQIPGAAIIIKTDPYYFSENDLGLKMLKFFQLPASPYLIPGKTSESSSFNEISSAFKEYTKNTEQKQIVSDQNRATVFSVEFSNGDLTKTYQFNSFQKFTHISKYQRNAPFYYQNIKYGLELESLPSMDKKLFYDELIVPSINPRKNPEPFDVTVHVDTGDGTTIQTWKYTKCTVNSYTPYLDENLAKLKFVGELVSEIREKTAFSCNGFNEDFTQKVATKKSESVLMPIIPTKEERADRIIVQFSGGELENTSSFYSFSKFMPLTKDPNSGLPISIPGNVIGEKPLFYLESLPSIDKEYYYKFVSRYINPGEVPRPFDVTIHFVTDSDTVLQSWKYTECSANNYVVFFTDNLLIYKFSQGTGSEIRDKTFFECSGLSISSDSKTKLDTSQSFLPNDYTTAQTFVVHFQGADISPEKTVTSFTKFSPISNEELQFLLPNSPFGQESKFYLESLPNKDNGWYYSLMSKFINAGKIPDPFGVTVDVMAGDGTRLQSWDYSKCQVMEYKTYLDDTLFLRKFTNKSEKEFRDRTIFQCSGVSFDGNSKPPQKTSEKPLNYVDSIPSDQSRITKLVATFSGGDIEHPFTINTIGKFTPNIEQRSQTQAKLVKLSVRIVPATESGSSSSLSLYDAPEYCAPGEEPPGCRPCPSNNPHCTDETPEEPDVPTEPEIPPIDSEVPGISSPTYTVIDKMPHLSFTQKNDFIKSTEFSIKSLPSKDKIQYYDMVRRYIDAGKKPEPFDVTFDYLSDDGTIIQSWKYTTCEIKDFQIKRDDILLYYSLSNVSGADIVDNSTFTCTGFVVDFDQKISNYTVTIPTPYDRAMLHLVHWYGGELQNQRSSELLQEFSTDGTNLQFGGLPNTYHKDVYQFVSRYTNPGKDPEPINMRFDTVTGDGTILFSTIYTDCAIKDSSVFLSDSIAVMKYTPGIKSEIRGQAIADCAGTHFKTLPQNDSKFDTTGNLRKISVMTQRAIGVPSEGVICSDNNSTLMIRPPNNVPICVKNEHISKFEERGWKRSSQLTAKNLTDVLRPILPTNDERAMSFVVNFEGTDITPQKTVETFSKFVPIEDKYATILRPGNPLDSSEKSFYLESLPNKENSWYYELASRYVNAGSKPESFNVTVQVKSGSEDILQTWKYNECEIHDYVSYYDENLLNYKFHGKWTSEIKDKSVFSCAGLSIIS